MMASILLPAREYLMPSNFRIGHFQWGGENFTETAEDVAFSIEGGGQVPVLRAHLKDEEGNLQQADVNLAERIENLNGELVFQ